MKIIFSLIAVCIALTGFSQSTATELPPFDRIVASQFINVVLEKGDKESVRFEYSGSNIRPEDMNMEVKRKKLRLFLTDARIIEKQQRYYENGYRYTSSKYKGSRVTAYITYKELRGVEIRGEEGLVCNSPINADKFKLKVFGENEVSLASLQSNKFKACIFGENNIEIKSGMIGHQLYRLFGENKIDTENLESNTTSSRIYGEGLLTVNATDQLNITAFGEPEIRLNGNAAINKNIILGVADIKVRR